MKTLIPPSSYISTAIFEEEQRKIFQRLWHFAGFRGDLAAHNDFITREIGGLSVVVQNFNGELRAFANVCSHRFNRIQTQCKGNRALQCGYHGWIYDEAGLPVGIPKKPRFEGLTSEKILELRLHAWRVECCGNLVFVCRGGGAPLCDYLGGCYERIAEMTGACGPVIDENVMMIKANWKILVENTLEAYHVGFIHSKTFARLGASEGVFEWHLPHSSWRTSLGASMSRRLEMIDALMESRPLKIDGYFHQLIFPNVTIATTLGTSFSVQFFEPISPAVTRFTSVVFQTKVGHSDAASAPMIEIVNHSARTFNRSVFDEDKEVCEQVQLGSAQTAQAGILSDDELRVGEFQKHYMQFMRDDYLEGGASCKDRASP